MSGAEDVHALYRSPIPDRKGASEGTPLRAELPMVASKGCLQLGPGEAEAGVEDQVLDEAVSVREELHPLEAAVATRPPGDDVELVGAEGRPLHLPADLSPQVWPVQQEQRAVLLAGPLAVPALGEPTRGAAGPGPGLVLRRRSLSGYVLRSDGGHFASRESLRAGGGTREDGNRLLGGDCHRLSRLRLLGMPGVLGGSLPLAGHQQLVERDHLDAVLRELVRGAGRRARDEVGLRAGLGGQTDVLPHEGLGVESALGQEGPALETPVDCEEGQREGGEAVGPLQWPHLGERDGAAVGTETVVAAGEEVHLAGVPRQGREDEGDVLEESEEGEGRGSPHLLKPTQTLVGVHEHQLGIAEAPAETAAMQAEEVLLSGLGETHRWSGGRDGDGYTELY